MRPWIAALFVGLALLAAAYFVTNADARVRPTFWEAHAATHIELEDYADLTGGHLVVGPCVRRGDFTTICRARIDGPVPDRYRVFVTGTPMGNYMVAVRRR